LKYYIKFFLVNLIWLPFYLFIWFAKGFLYIEYVLTSVLEKAEPVVYKIHDRLRDWLVS
jgi:hypothetical protein